MSRRSPRLAARAGISPQKGAAFQLKTQNVIPLAEVLSVKPVLNDFNLLKDRALPVKESQPIERVAATEQEENQSQSSLNESLEGSSICERTIYPDSFDPDCSISSSNILGELSSDFLTDYDIELEFNGRDSEVESVWSLGSPRLEALEDDQGGVLGADNELEQLADDVASLNYSDFEDMHPNSP